MRHALLGVVCIAVLSACERDDEDLRLPEAGGGPLAGARAPGSEDGEWRMSSKDFQATRYSGLAQITTENVSGLRPVWNFSTGELRGH